MLYSIIILPIVNIMEFIFTLLFNFTSNFTASIILLSLVINFALIPVFKWAEKIKNKEIAKKAVFEDEINKIKAVFKGKEGYFYTKEVYRRYKYHPISSIFTLLPLFIQIPIFISAFAFLSNYNFNNTFLQNPDALAFGFNLLPLMMTFINILSSIIYASKMKEGERLQLLTIAGVFFVLLYQSPASLLIYWITSNIFSLLKNSISFKIANHKASLFKAFCEGFCSIFLVLQKHQVFIIKFCIFLSFYFILQYFAFAGRKTIMETDGLKLSILVSLISFFILLPNLWRKQKILSILAIAFLAFLLYKLIFVFNFYDPKGVKNFRTLCFSSTLIALLMAFFKYKPKFTLEKVNRGLFYPSLIFFALTFLVFNPIIIFSKSQGYNSTIPQFLIFTLASSALFILLFSALFEAFKKFAFSKILTNVVIFFAISGIIHNFIFVKDYGVLNGYSIQDLFFIEKGIMLWLVDCIIFFVLCFYGVSYAKKNKDILNFIFIIFLVAGFGRSVYFALKYKPQEVKIQTQTEGELPHYNKKAMSYSKNGKNIVVFFIDALSGDEIFDIQKRNPEVLEKFDGFTNYVNTISISPQTHSSVSSLFGGHDFSVPSKFFQTEGGGNLIQKTDIAYEHFFANMKKEGADVTIADPQMTEKGCNLNNGNFNCVSSSDYNSFYLSQNEMNVLKLPSSIEVPLFFEMLSIFNSIQMIFHKKYSRIMDDIFDFPDISKISLFATLPQISSVEDSSETKVKYLYTLGVHLPNFLNSDCKIIGALQLAKNSMEENYYQSAKCSLIFISNFILWLKQNNIYDNTKIIIVSDHGVGFKSKYADEILEKQVKKLNQPKDFTYKRTIATLLVKDYKERGSLKADTRLMSNGDVPSIVCSGLSPSCPEFYKDPIKNNINRKFVYHYFVRERYVFDTLSRATTYKILAEIEVSGDLYKKENVRIKDFQ